MSGKNDQTICEGCGKYGEYVSHIESYGRHQLRKFIGIFNKSKLDK